MPLPPRAAAVVVLLVAFNPISRAQVSRNYAALEGQVCDTTGAAIASAQVTAQNLATSATRSVAASVEGRFVMFQLPVGEYRLRITAPGFAAYDRPLTLAVGQFARVTIELPPASTQQNLTVTAEPSTLDVSQPTVATTVDKERIEELPVHSRNYLNFVLLAPGVSSSPAPTAGATTSQTVLAESGFTFAGLRPTSNSVSIDGVSNNDEFSGAARSELSLETVREFQVVNNGLSAESGGSSGGAINVVTRAGSNIHHGDAFLFAENGALDAPPKFKDVPGKPDLSRYRVGLSLGGAIVRDRTFYYLGFEQEHNRGQVAGDVSPQVIAAINPLLATGALPALATRTLTLGYFPAARAETEATARFDHQISPRHSLTLRYAFTNNRQAGDAFNDSGLFDASAHGSAFTADHALSGSLASVLSQTVVNDLRFQAATRRLVLRTNDVTGPEIDVAGLVTFGRTFAGNGRRRENLYEAGDTLSLLRGSHLWKLGGTVRRLSENLLQPDGFAGQFTFASLADLFAGTPQFYLQAFGNPRIAFGVTELGAFLQHHWTISPRLTLDTGLRYDFEHLPSTFNHDRDNFSPRVGFAFTPAAGWVLRGGYGIYFDRYLLAAIARPLEYDGSRAWFLAADGAPATAFFRSLVGGSPLPLPAIAPSIFTAQPHLPASYSQQASFGVERELAKNWTTTADFLHVRGVKLSRTVNGNLAPPATGALFPLRRNPQYDDTWQLAGTAGSTYNGLSLVLNRRMSDEIEFTGAYTLSRTTDDASSFEEQPQNPYDVAAERALSRYDQRHRFVFSGLFDLPIGDEEGQPRTRPKQHKGLLTTIFGNIELAPIFTAGSARPVNPLTGLDSNLAHTIPFAARPAGMRRNSLRLPATAFLDFRVLKYFLVGEHGKLDVVAEWFNLTNRTSVAAINPFFGAGPQPLPAFAQPTDALDSRQAQFSLDFEF